MTTVGYGDVFATTYMGRTVTIMLAVSASFMMAIVVGVVASSFALAPNEKLTAVHQKVTIAAEDSLKKSLKYFLVKKAYYISRKEIHCYQQVKE